MPFVVCVPEHAVVISMLGPWPACATHASSVRLIALDASGAGV